MTSGTLNDFQNFIRQKRADGEDIRIPKPAFNTEENTFSGNPDADFQQRKKDLVENFTGGKLTKKVEVKTEQSGFSYFLDGIEKKRILCYYRSIPFIYGYVAGAILKRTDKKIHSCDTEKSEGVLYIPVKEDKDAPEHYLDLTEIKGISNYKNIGEIVQKGNIKDYPRYPEEFIKQAHSEIQEQRRKIESDLTDTWIDSGFDDGMLFVDGTLNTKSKKVLESSKVVGVVKSHGVNYFSFEEMYELYNMKKGERSAVFQPYDNSENKKDIYTWYLRIHSDNRNGVNDFGIVRVEIPAKSDLLSRVDEISSWILLETKPVGFPASRWDRMIYPIKYCEDYLKSKAPSRAMIDSLR